MEAFILVAGAHFLALLSPGPDFLLIVRTALVAGMRRAAAVCLGVALANGVFIAAAAAGFALLTPGSVAFLALRWAGAVYLFYLGVCLWRAAGRAPADERAVVSRPGGGHRWLTRGFLSAILNPKNALFYAGLFSALSGRGVDARTQAAYGVWMFLVVLGWDLLLAWLVARRGGVPGAGRYPGMVERIAGTLLIGLALGIVVG